MAPWGLPPAALGAAGPWLWAPSRATGTPVVPGRVEGGPDTALCTPAVTPLVLLPKHILFYVDLHRRREPGASTGLPPAVGGSRSQFQALLRLPRAQSGARGGLQLAWSWQASS